MSGKNVPLQCVLFLLFDVHNAVHDKGALASSNYIILSACTSQMHVYSYMFLFLAHSSQMSHPGFFFLLNLDLLRHQMLGFVCTQE